MQQRNEPFDIISYSANRDIDNRIRASRDDVLLIVQADIKRLDGKIDTVKTELQADIKALDERLSAKIDSLDVKIDSVDKRLDHLTSFTKWIVGIGVTILIAIVGLAVPILVAVLR